MPDLMPLKEHKPTERVLDILEVLASNPNGLSLSDISREIGASKSTIHAIVHALSKRRFIYLDEKTHLYYVGLAAYCVGQSFNNNHTALEFFTGEMKIIAKNLGEICQLGMLDGANVLYLAKEEGQQDAVRVVSYVGKRLPAYSTAIGKALLSKKTISDLKSLYPEGLISFTPNTIVDYEKLYDELQQTQINGYAKENCEYNNETCCFAIPIVKDDDVLLALSVSFPAYRFSDKKADEIIKTLLSFKTPLELFVSQNNLSKDQLFLH